MLTSANQVVNGLMSPTMNRRLFRTMKQDHDGLPKVESSRNGLGVRVKGRELNAKKLDIELDANEHVQPKQGASVAVESPRKLPGALRPLELGGTSKFVMFDLQESDLPNSLEVADLRTDGHAVLGTRTSCTLPEYEEALGSTRKDWHPTDLTAWKVSQ